MFCCESVQWYAVSRESCTWKNNVFLCSKTVRELIKLFEPVNKAYGMLLQCECVRFWYVNEAGTDLIGWKGTKHRQLLWYVILVFVFIWMHGIRQDLGFWFKHFSMVGNMALMRSKQSTSWKYEVYKPWSIPCSVYVLEREAARGQQKRKGEENPTKKE